MKPPLVDTGRRLAAARRLLCQWQAAAGCSCPHELEEHLHQLHERNAWIEEARARRAMLATPEPLQPYAVVPVEEDTPLTRAAAVLRSLATLWEWSSWAWSRCGPGLAGVRQAVRAETGAGEGGGEVMEKDTLDAMCLTYQHDYALRGHEEQAALRKQLLPLYKHHVKPLKDEVERMRSELMALTTCKTCGLSWQAESGVEPCPRCERNALLEALTPSAETKGEYTGEFSFRIPEFDPEGNEHSRIVMVPWDNTKDIMKAIRARAGVVAQPKAQAAPHDDTVDILMDVVEQACTVGGVYDSLAIGAYTDALRCLAKAGRLRITLDQGRRVIAERVEQAVASHPRDAMELVAHGGEKVRRFADKDGNPIRFMAYPGDHEVEDQPQPGKKS